MVNSYYNDPISMSTEERVTGKEVTTSVTVDNDGNNVEDSVFFKWERIGDDVEYSFEVLSYPENCDRSKVERDAEVSVLDELRDKFPKCGYVRA